MIWDGMDSTILNVVRGWSNVQRTIYITRCEITRRLWIWTQNVHIWSAALVIMKMDQNFQEQVMWPAQNVMIYISSDVKWWREYVFKKAPHMPSIALVILIIVIIAKNGISKTSSNYGELYTTRIGFACRFRICSQNIKLEPTWSVIAWFILKCVIEHLFNHNKSSNR